MAELNVTAKALSVCYHDANIHSRDSDATNINLRLKGNNLDLLLEIMSNATAAKVWHAVAQIVNSGSPVGPMVVCKYVTGPWQQEAWNLELTKQPCPQSACQYIIGHKCILNVAPIPSDIIYVAFCRNL